MPSLPLATIPQNAGMIADLPVPSNARLDLAYQDVITLPDPAPGTTADFTIPGNYCFYCTQIRYDFATSATVINRLPTLLVFDNAVGGREIVRVSVAAVVGASTTQQCSWLGNASSAYSVSTVSVSPLPLILFTPGMLIDANSVNFQFNDAVRGFRMTGVKIPTGPRAESQTGPSPSLPLVLV